VRYDKKQAKGDGDEAGDKEVQEAVSSRQEHAM